MSPQNHNELVESNESETETFDSDDSHEDPSFDLLEEARSKFSNLSIKKKSRSRGSVKRDEDAECDSSVELETAAAEFDANDEKSFEIVQKIIEGSQVEKLKVEQCKVYLRKHGLRLTGKKDILIQRIKEHISIMNGEGEQKYPAFSFVINCKGDACTGDVVMFEQNVYEMFNVASRSASGPPCGQRMVAGRIVKESYGAAKQQHTFIIEVLWSKGHKPLPPLHPLLIKGRNLYKLKTMRQRWEDESERRKILSEKHARGNAARTNRDARLQEKEIKKALRASKGDFKNTKQEMKTKQPPTHPILNPKTSVQHTGVPLGHYNKNHGPPSTENMNPNRLTSPLRNRFDDSRSFQRVGYAPLGHNQNQNHGPQSTENMNPNRLTSPLRNRFDDSRSFQRVGYAPLGHNQNQNHGPQSTENMNPIKLTSPLRNRFEDSRSFQRVDYGPLHQVINNGYSSYQNHHGVLPYADGSLRNRFRDEQNMRGLYPSRLSERHDLYKVVNNGCLLPRDNHHQGKRQQLCRPRDNHHQGKRQQLCRYYAQGRCHYGTDCKYLHLNR